MFSTPILTFHPPYIYLASPLRSRSTQLYQFNYALFDIIIINLKRLLFVSLHPLLNPFPDVNVNS